MISISDLLNIKESPLPHKETALDWSRSSCGRPSFGGVYVGKASDLAKRIGLHLKLKTSRTVAPGAVNGVCERMTTSCQVRDRLDRLFPNLPDTRSLALDNLALSYARIEAFVERFFLEDLAVGMLRPIFNVDSER